MQTLMIQTVMSIRTAQPLGALEALARTECRGAYQIQSEDEPSMSFDDKRRVTVVFASPTDRDRFRRALTDLPLLSQFGALAQQARPAGGLFNGLFS